MGADAPSNGVLTFLTGVCPIGLDGMEEGFAKTGHKRHFPHDGLDPGADRFNLDVAKHPVGRDWDECDVYLFRLVAVGSKIGQVAGRKVWAGFCEPCVLGVGQQEVGED